MCATPLHIEIIGLVAGGIISVSAIPRIVAIWKTPDLAYHESIVRNAMLVLGNAIWISYGVLSGLVALPAMCALAMSTNAFVLVAALVAQIRKHQRT